MRRSLVLFLGTCLILFAACSTRSPVSLETTSIPPLASAEVSEVEELEVPEDPSSDAIELKVGDAFSIGNWDVEIDSLIIVKEFDSYTVEEGSKFVVLNLQVKNLGTESAVFTRAASPMATDVVFKLYYQDTYEFRHYAFPVNPDDLVLTYIQPLTTVSGFIGFVVPDEAAVIEEITITAALGDELFIIVANV